MVSKEMPEETQRILSALSYPIGIVALVVVLIAKKRENYVRYHGFQGLFFNCAWLLAYMMSIIVIKIVDTLPFVGDILSSIFGIIFGVLGIAVFVISILLAVRAYQNEKFRIPVLYELIPSNAR